MPQAPAARLTDAVVHLPPVLTGGPPALNVLIGNMPAWKGIPLAMGPGLQAAQQASEAAIKVAENIAVAAQAAAVAAAGTPGAPAAVVAATAARLAAETLKASSAAAMSATIAAAAAGGASIHACTTPWPIPPHGPGVVIDGSPTVLINNVPACRQGGTIVEAIGPPNKIVMGCFTVTIGDSGSGGPSMALAASLVVARGSADGYDAALVAMDLARFPPDILQRMIDNRTVVVVCRGSITDYRTDLRGVHPRGWPPGSTWDSVPGVHTGDTHEVVIATIGHGTPAGPHVPATGEGHGSSSVVLHESAHSLDMPDAGTQRSTGADFNRARTADAATLDAYEGQPGAAGQQETYAESAARYYSGDPTDAAQHPNLHNYWATNPLRPTP